MESRLGHVPPPSDSQTGLVVKGFGVWSAGKRLTRLPQRSSSVTNFIAPYPLQDYGNLAGSYGL